MKLISIIIAIALPIFGLAQSDTLSKNNERLLRLIGGLVQSNIQKQLKEDGTANGVKGLLGSTIKNVLKTTAQKSAAELIKVDLGGQVGLPQILQDNKTRILEKGKTTLFNNFEQSLKYSANEALGKAIPLMVAQAIDFNLDSLVAYAAGKEVNVTGIFKNASKANLLKMVEPIAKASFLQSFGKRCNKKMNKTLSSILGQTTSVQPETIISELIVEKFLSQMQHQEQMLKSNPLGLVENLLNLFKD